MAKISVIGGVSDVNAPAPVTVAPVLVGEAGPELIQVEDILAGAIALAPSSAEPPAKKTARKRTA